MSDVTLKAIKDLKRETGCYYIPDYQRGYRWKKQHAIELLDDILSFAETKKKNSKDKCLLFNQIYCIQPLVIKKEDTENGNRLVVVDGQQRLTTILMLLACLLTTDEEKEEFLYSVEYFREGSKAYLEHLIGVESQTKDSEQDFCQDPKENIDFFHMNEVKTALCEKLEELPYKNKKQMIKKTLLEDVCFIWYPIQENEMDVFRRLNIGKIPLTEAELVKALLLNESYYQADVDSKTIDGLSVKDREKHSELWDQIEQGLQNDEFWYFLSNKDCSTRIELVLDMICLRHGAKSSTVHHVFNYYYEKIKNAKRIDDTIRRFFEEIEDYYRILDEWYHDYRMYHYIGFLTSAKRTQTEQLISILIKEWNSPKTRGEFINELKCRIVKELSQKTWIKNWDTFEFETDDNSIRKTECRPFLLLHNVETIIQQNNKLIEESRYRLPNYTKFPFHLFKKENWDIEHIRSNHGDDIDDPMSQSLQLFLIADYLKSSNSDKKLIDRCRDFIETDSKDINEYKEILIEVNNSIDPNHKMLASSEETEYQKNLIWNYTLLDSSTNREYQNAIFPIKRSFIASKENGIKIKFNHEKLSKIKINDYSEFTEAIKDFTEDIPEIAFVPICTKNVFSKFYTPYPQNLSVWTEDDAKAYRDDMKLKLERFIADVKIIISAGEFTKGASQLQGTNYGKKLKDPNNLLSIEGYISIVNEYYEMRYKEQGNSFTSIYEEFCKELKEWISSRTEFIKNDLLLEIKSIEDSLKNKYHGKLWTTWLKSFDSNPEESREVLNEILIKLNEDTKTYALDCKHQRIKDLINDFITAERIYGEIESI